MYDEEQLGWLASDEYERAATADRPRAGDIDDTDDGFDDDGADTEDDLGNDGDARSSESGGY